MKMINEVDILENDINTQYPGVLDILLRDHTTQKNIFWATNNYKELGSKYSYYSHISTDLITGERGKVIMPRVKKNKDLQQARIRDMAEVFTPLWICNLQNNLIDNVWFGKENVFNKEITDSNGVNSWKVSKKKISFPQGKTWKDYIRDTRLEITCGEAPYITSRYDTVSGDFIPIESRIGLLDRKLRVISENVESSGEWLKNAQIAFENTFAYEWQGDSLLIARESMLFTFIENYFKKFNKKPLLKSIKYIAYIISWNVWQMDGLKGVIPNSCGESKSKIINLFGEVETDSSFCLGCLDDNILKHNGKYCLIKDWGKKDLESGRKGRKIKFIDLLKN